MKDSNVSTSPITMIGYMRTTASQSEPGPSELGVWQNLHLMFLLVGYCIALFVGATVAYFSQ